MPVTRAAAASLSFWKSLIITDFWCCFARSLFSASTAAFSVVPTCTATLRPDSDASPVTWAGLPVLTMSDMPTST